MFTITPTTLPPAVNGTAYMQTLTVAGGTAPYTWSMPVGVPPAGLTFAAGVLSGTPTAAAFADLTVLVTDSSSPAQSASIVYYFAVCPAVLRVGIQIDGAAIIAAVVPTALVFAMIQGVALNRVSGTGAKVYADLPTLFKALMTSSLQALLNQYPSGALQSAQGNFATAQAALQSAMAGATIT
jgi:hypothetical protein